MAVKMKAMGSSVSNVMAGNNKLYRLCCKSGFSRRDWLRRIWDAKHYNRRVDFLGMEAEMFFSGSTAEGLQARILQSDLDVTFRQCGIRAVDGSEDARDENNITFETITTDNPAYVHLALSTRQDLPAFHHASLGGLVNVDGRDYLPGNFRANYSPALPALQINGPAVQQTQPKIDSVNCIHMNNWPSDAMEWFVRQRPYNWPNHELIQRILEIGIDLVPVGRGEDRLEWRYSSSTAEALLVENFNETQMQCFFLMKLIRVYRLKPKFGDAISSYQIKTIMLYLAEQEDQRLWTKETLTECFTKCLKALSEYLEVGNLPQYFLPGENLFENKFNHEVQLQLKALVSEWESIGWMVLLECEPFQHPELLVRPSPLDLLPV